MTMEQQIDRELSYFTDVEHIRSFELLDGKGQVLISAPHAVLQTRQGSIKCAERYTGMLCRLLHERLQCPVIYKTRHLNDDANHDAVSDYREELCRYIKAKHIRYVLDLHQLAPERPMQVCICTGKQRNLFGKLSLVEDIRAAFAQRLINQVTVDNPFDASAPHTVSSTVANRCGIPAIQLELNTRLLMNEYHGHCFLHVLDALSDVVHRLNAPDQAVL